MKTSSLTHDWSYTKQTEIEIVWKYSKTCFKRPLKKNTKLVFNTDYRLMQVQSIAECSNGSILQYFRPSFSYHFPLRPLFCLLLEWPLKTGFIVFEMNLHAVNALKFRTPVACHTSLDKQCRPKSDLGSHCLLFWQLYCEFQPSKPTFYLRTEKIVFKIVQKF